MIKLPAIDLKSIDKRRAAIVAASVFAGLIAVVLTNGYISREKAKALKNVTPDNKQLTDMSSRIRGLEEVATKLIQERRQPPSQQQQVALPPRIEETLALKTPAGKRAITVTVESLHAVGGLVNPGDYVDVIAHLSVPTDPDNSSYTENISVTLFQNVKVLSVAGRISSGAAAARSGSVPITFALNPQEAELMSFAQQHGRLQLVLRSSVDTEAYVLPAANWKTLAEYIKSTQGMDIGWKESKKPESFDIPAEEPKPDIEIFRGGSR